MALIAGPILALALFAFLRWSAYGIALRAAAENTPRARLLGIPVRRVSTMAWVIAARARRACGAILLAPIIGFSATEAVGLPLLMRGLAAATIAGMESVGAAFGAGLALGVADQLVFFWTRPQRAHRPRAARRDPRRAPLAAGRVPADDGSGGVVVGRGRAGAAAAAGGRRATRGGGPRSLRRAAGVVVVAAILPFVLTSASTFFIAIGCARRRRGRCRRRCSRAGPARCRSDSGRSPASAACSAPSSSPDFGVPFWIAFVAAALLGGVVALCSGCRRCASKGTTLAVVTLGFAVAAASWLFEQSWFRARELRRPARLPDDARLLLRRARRCWSSIVPGPLRRTQRGWDAT